MTRPLLIVLLICAVVALGAGKYRIMHSAASLVVPAGQSPASVPSIKTPKRQQQKQRGGPPPPPGHPECRWLCDDPISHAVCRPVCKKPACEIDCPPGPPDILNCEPPICEIRCPIDQVESDACPACETVCRPVSCYPYHHQCSPLCEATECFWECKKPLNPTKVQCELTCEMPACEISDPPLPFVPVYPRRTFNGTYNVLARSKSRLVGK